MAINFEKQIDLVRRRWWEDLRSVWPAHISPMSAGAPPDEEVVDLPEVRRACSELLASESKYIDVDMTTPRTLVVRTALFQFHKASHVISAAEKHASEGYRSWSVSSAYEGALMAARSLMAMLGVVVVDLDQRSIVVDVFAQQEEARKLRSRGQRVSEVCRFIRGGHRLGHREIWALFQRCIRVTAAGSIPGGGLQLLKNVDTSRIPKQRNTLHYSAGAWLFDDLFELQPTKAFGVVSDFDNVDENVPEFTHQIAFALLRIAALIVEDLAETSNVVQAEFSLFEEVLGKVWGHPAYRQSFV